ncbi:MAG: hypothetical protein IRY99_00245 [Isosphaeraceae bacterium]|nr:hypothetical protein [Isosphaeraceae bacterium]
MSVGEALQPRLDRLQTQALIAGAIGLGVCLLVALIRPGAFFPSYLVAYLFWVGIALGCVSITMLHHLVGGSWGWPVRRPLESGAMTIIPMAVLFLPLVLGMQTLYPWARPEAGHDPILLHKRAYLNPGGFVLRAVIDFGLWGVFAYLLNRWSLQQDRMADIAPTRRLRTLSGPGLAILFLTASFAAIDWIMSIEPHWYSSIYGAMIIVGMGLETFAFAIVVASLLARYEPVRSVATPTRFQDLGNLMLAFVMLWAYIAFSQFLIIWCGNLTEEIPWYLRRTRGGWQYVALALILFHFFAPFFFLLFRETKRRLPLLMGVALAIIVMHLVDLFWLVIPPYAGTNPTYTLIDLFVVLIATVGIGGIWVTFFLRQLKGKPLIPLHDPDINPDVEISPPGGNV